MSTSNRDPDKVLNPAAASQDQADLIRSRSSSLESLSSGGDSDGGPEEPNPAEISLLSASLDCRNVEVSREPLETLAVTETEALVEVVPVFPAGFHRLPSAMRPPVRRGHMRSSSAGGSILNFKGQNLLQVCTTYVCKRTVGPGTTVWKFKNFSAIHFYVESLLVKFEY